MLGQPEKPISTIAILWPVKAIFKKRGRCGGGRYFHYPSAGMWPTASRWSSPVVSEQMRSVVWTTHESLCISFGPSGPERPVFRKRFNRWSTANHPPPPQRPSSSSGIFGGWCATCRNLRKGKIRTTPSFALAILIVDFVGVVRGFRGLKPDSGAYRGLVWVLCSPSNPQNCRKKRRILKKGTSIFLRQTLVCTISWFKRDLMCMGGAI